MDRNGDGLFEYDGSGNSDPLRRPNNNVSNWWDDIGFGHQDAYGNALAYRALREMAGLAKAMDQREDAARYAAAADRLRHAYYKTFYNPATGVLAGWRSADGQLHDYHFLFVNGAAIHYGLIETDKANAIMDRLLAKIKEVGYRRFDLGLPGNLTPVAMKDYRELRARFGGGQKEDGSEGFQHYENGGATACFAYFTLAALYDLGRREEADRMLFPMLAAFAKGGFEGRGPDGRSYDWKSWDGAPWGYEGFLSDNYYALLAVLAREGPSVEVTISNVKPRRDVEGKIVDAHDGCLQKFGGRYFLYGTNYGKSDYVGKNNCYRCYSSADLVTWKLEGELLPEHPDGVYYRPYVVYNAKTRKYVLWYNWYRTLWDGQYGVATSDQPQGPFTIREQNVPVSRSKPGDLDLLVDDDATAYLIYTSIAEDHAVSVEKLTDDYLRSTKENGGVLAKDCEAPALIKRGGTYYALFDYCCCACPQGSGVRVYTASKPLGPYTRQKININRDARGKTVIRAQQTHVARIPTANGLLYVWMGDRWHSSPDGTPGHDFQYWAPLWFDPSGGIEPLKWLDQWTVVLTR